MQIKLSSTTSASATNHTVKKTRGYLVVVGALLVGFGLGRLGRRQGGEDLSSSSCTKTEDSAAQPATTTKTRIQDAGPGWHAVHVYYGDRDHHLEPYRRKNEKKESYSQEGQDMYALELLNHKRNGYFVDLASNHPVKLSNTFLLEKEYDWNGLCIEPNWQYWNGLASLRRCQVIGAVGGGNPSVSTSEAIITFRFHPFKRFIGAFGGIVGEEFNNKPNGEKPQDVIEEQRFTVALAVILETFGAPKVIDYLSLDVEGAEDLILGQLPFDQYTFLVLNVERPSPTLKNRLEENGYELLRNDKYGDTIWKHKSLVSPPPPPPPPQ